MEREACVCDHGFERSDLCAEIIIIIIIIITDRASTIPSNIRGCQSGTWSAGQKKDQRNIYQAPMRAREKHKNTKNDKDKETGITKYTGQKRIDEGHSIERVWHSASREPSDTSPARNHAPKNA